MDLLITKELLFQHFEGKTTALQKRLIEQWLQSEINQEYFFQSLAEWENRSPTYMPEMDEALNSYIDFMERTSSHSESNPTEIGSDTSRRRIPPGWIMIAAGLCLFMLTGWLYRKTIWYRSYATTFGETSTFQLSDGSKVTLNSNSSLLVPRMGFGKKDREVILQGEAYFSITHMENHKSFIVKTKKDFDVVVLGTEFSVYTRPGGSKVLLNKGKVQVRFEDKEKPEEITLKPGELLTLDNQGHTGIHSVEAEKFIAWKDHRFVFEQTKVSELVGLLAEVYGLSVEIKGEKLANRTLEGTFQAENADELLQTISELLKIRFIHKNNKVILHE